MSSSQHTDPTASLGELLDAAGQGDLHNWHALPDGATTHDLLKLQPGAEPARDLTTVLGQPAKGYRLPATPHAPAGVIVWTQHDEVTLIEVDGPELVDPVETLGPPQATVHSGLGVSLDQQLWPARGLILHVARATGRVARMYGHHAASVDQMQSSPLANVRIERHPR
jgi:hypothetical protein